MWQDGWWMLWGGLMMLLFWGGVIALGFWLVQSLTRREPGTGDAPAALRIAEASAWVQRFGRRLCKMGPGGYRTQTLRF